MYLNILECVMKIDSQTRNSVGSWNFLIQNRLKPINNVQSNQIVKSMDDTVTILIK